MRRSPGSIGSVLCDRVTVQETCLWSHGVEIRRTSDSQQKAHDDEHSHALPV